MSKVEPDPYVPPANYDVVQDGQEVKGQEQANLRVNPELQSDGILTLDRINSLSLSNKVKFNYDAGDPILPRGGFSDLRKVANALSGGNPWLASSYMARITENIMEIWKVQKDISLAEAASTISSMELVMVLGEELGEIIMNKAEKEAEMYRALGITACVALTISLVGLGLSITGNTLASRAKTARDKAGADTPEAATSAESPSVAGNKPSSAAGRSVNADLDAPSAPEPMPSASPTGPSAPKNKGPDSSADLHQTSSTRDSNRSSTSSDAVEDSALPDNSATIGKSKPSATTGRDEGRVRTTQEAEAEGPSTDQAKTTKGTPEDRSRAADRLDSHSARLNMGGKWMMEYTSVMERAVENFIQAGFKPQIAAFERDMEIIRAAQQIVRQAMENSAKGNTDAQQVFQAAADLLQKIADENTRAYSMGRG